MLKCLRYCVLIGIVSMPSFSAFAEPFPFSESDTEKAGNGCVGGFTNKGYRVSHHRGDVTLLNEQLAIVKKHESEFTTMRVELELGPGRAFQPIDRTPGSSSKISVNWTRWEIDPEILRYIPDERASSSRSFKLFSKPVIPLRIPATRGVLFKIWIDEDLTIPKLEIPSCFWVDLSEDIERIVDFVASRREIERVRRR